MKRHPWLAITLAASCLAAIASNAQAAQVVYDDQWDSEQKESESNFDCRTRDNKNVAGVMIWRTHIGGKEDENSPTQVGCATLRQLGKVLKLKTGDDAKAEIKIDNEETGYSIGQRPDGTYEFTSVICPGNMVMVGRRHKGDETKSTTYYCQAVLDPLDETKTLTVVERRWLGNTLNEDGTVTRPWVRESGFSLKCAQNEVMTGRWHHNDENGPSAVQCAKLF